MCLYRYRVWPCGCDERFLTRRCSYSQVKGHVLHKDRERRDVSVKGPCPWDCPTRRSKMPKPEPDLLAQVPTYIIMGKFALGLLKEATKSLIEKDPEILESIRLSEKKALRAGAKPDTTMPYVGGADAGGMDV